MLKKLEGKIASFRAVSKRKVQLELQGIEKFIELTVSDPWVINRGDSVVVAGEEDVKTGKFIGYAYRNKTKGISGKYDAGVITGYIFVIAGLFFFWTIFPLFLHVPIGLRAIALHNRVNQAASML
ncbi:hypothetical protein [Photorhabdus viridis]|uniref:hypothetical protein n=1 Tax=Photorhabdus viridis TaxID=3163327 RepID=UPI003307BA45